MCDLGLSQHGLFKKGKRLSEPKYFWGTLQQPLQQVSSRRKQDLCLHNIFPQPTINYTSILRLGSGMGSLQVPFTILHTNPVLRHFSLLDGGMNLP